MNVNQVSATYRIFGDGRLLYTSPLIHSGVSPVPIDIYISGIMSLRIEVEFQNGLWDVGGATNPGRNFDGGLTLGDFGGIRHATIVTR